MMAARVNIMIVDSLAVLFKWYRGCLPVLLMLEVVHWYQQKC